MKKGTAAGGKRSDNNLASDAASSSDDKLASDAADNNSSSDDEFTSDDKIATDDQPVDRYELVAFAKTQDLNFLKSSLPSDFHMFLRGKTVLMLFQYLEYFDGDPFTPAIQRFGRHLKLVDFLDQSNPDAKIDFLHRVLQIGKKFPSAFLSVWKQFGREYSDEELLYYLGLPEPILVELFVEPAIPLSIFEALWRDRLQHIITPEYLTNPKNDTVPLPRLLVENMNQLKTDGEALMLVWNTPKFKIPLTKYLIKTQIDVNWTYKSGHKATEKASLLGLLIRRCEANPRLAQTIEPLEAFISRNLDNPKIFEDTRFFLEQLGNIEECEKNKEWKLKTYLLNLPPMKAHPKWDIDEIFRHFCHKNYWIICRVLLIDGRFNASTLTDPTVLRALPLDLKLQCLRKFRPFPGTAKFRLDPAFVTESPLPDVLPLPPRGKVDSTQTFIEFIEAEDKNEQDKRLRTVTFQEMLEQNKDQLPSMQLLRWTPLFSAIAAGRERFIPPLLDACPTLLNRSDMGHCALSLAFLTQNTPLVRKLLPKLKTELKTPDAYQTFLADFVKRHPYTLLTLMGENEIDFLVKDQEKQNALSKLYSTVRLEPYSLNFLLSKILSSRVRRISLEDQTGQPDQTKLKTLREVCQKYPWINLNITNYNLEAQISATKETPHDISLEVFYPFYNEMLQWLEINQKKEAAPRSAALPAAPQPSRPAAPTLSPPPSSAPSPKASPARPHGATKTQVDHQKKKRGGGGKAPKGTGVVPQRKVSTEPPKPLDHPISKVAAAGELPRFQGPIFKLQPGQESKIDLDALSREVKMEAASKEDTGPDAKIHTELTFIRELSSERDRMKEILQGLLNKDDQTPRAILNMALLDNLFKTNRALFLQKDDLTHKDILANKDIYEFDCRLIHGIYGFLDDSKLQANFEFFINACFVSDGFQLFNSTHRDSQAFHTQILGSLANPQSSQATKVRLQLMKSLLQLITDCYPLLEKEESIRQIALHCISACMSLLGEQYARLEEFDPELYKKIKDTPLGKILDKYRFYRNLRHGVNPKPLTLTSFQVGDTVETGFISTDKDQQECLFENIEALRKTDLQVINGRKSGRLLDNSIEELTQRCQLQSEAPAPSTLPLFEVFKAAPQGRAQQKDKHSGLPEDIVTAMKGLNLSQGPRQ
ncbi:MAG: hypothetical protein ACHQJ6_02325 [Candidatus Berkiellales bacterium]